MSHNLRSSSTSSENATLEQTQSIWQLEKKNIAKVSLSTETLTEVFGYLTRRELCQLIYPVSSQVYNIATSSHLLPVVHSIDSLCFYEAENIDFVSIRYLDRSANWKSNDFTVDEFLATMPSPGKFIRFQEIYVFVCLPLPLIEYLYDTCESFVGCDLELFTTSSDNPARDHDSLHEQVKYLLQNVFHSPIRIQLGHGHDLTNLPILHERVIPKCSKLRVSFSELDNCTQDTNNALLDWLTAKPDNEIASNEKKHLVLARYPRSIILDMIQQVKNDFETATQIQMSDSVITFVASRESKDYCLEDDPQFSVDNPLTDERLSLFNCIPGSLHHSPNHVYRLWRRRVTNETEDCTKFCCLLGDMKYTLDDEVEFDHVLFSYP